jgi:hypothetical protein
VIGALVPTIAGPGEGRFTFGWDGVPTWAAGSTVR